MIDAYRPYIQEGLKITAAASAGFYFGGRYAGIKGSQAQRRLATTDILRPSRDWIGQVQDTLFIVLILLTICVAAWMYFDYTGDTNAD